MIQRSCQNWEVNTFPTDVPIYLSTIRSYRYILVVVVFEERIRYKTGVELSAKDGYSWFIESDVQ